MRVSLFSKTVVSIVLIAILLPITATAGWGVDSGRATEQDVMDLQTDWLALHRSMTSLQRAATESTQHGRFLQLLGIQDGEGKYSVAELILMGEKWYRDNVLALMSEIAKNPAASCAESSQMLSFVLGMQRQRQLLSIIAEGDGPYTGDGAVLWPIIRARCQEEAVDECNTTGRFEQILDLWAQEGRQMQLISVPGEPDDKWAMDALKQCANYELHYRSEGDINDAFKLHTLIDGRIPMKLIQDDGPNSINEILFSKTLVEGKTKSDVNPFLETVSCSGEGVVVKCSPGGSVERAAWAQLLTFKRKYKQFDVVHDVGRNFWSVTQSQKGETKLEVKFLSAMLKISSFVVTKVGVFPVPIGGSGGTSFYIAHGDKRVEGENVLLNEASTRGTIKTGVYPVLFEFSIQGSGEEGSVPASDMTRFELIHKPKKQPLPAKAPPKPRVPLKPRSRP